MPQNKNKRIANIHPKANLGWKYKYLKFWPSHIISTSNLCYNQQKNLVYRPIQRCYWFSKFLFLAVIGHFCHFWGRQAGYFVDSGAHQTEIRWQVVKSKKTNVLGWKYAQKWQKWPITAKKRQKNGKKKKTLKIDKHDFRLINNC